MRTLVNSFPKKLSITALAFLSILSLVLLIASCGGGRYRTNPQTNVQNPSTSSDSGAFYDEFENNDMKWFVGKKGTGRGNIGKGVYTLRNTSKKNGYVVWNNRISIPYQGDYCVASRMAKVGGPSGHSYGLVWGFKDPSTHCRFLITDNGTVGIFQYEKGDLTQILPLQPTQALAPPKQYNELVIAKQKNRVYFFLNNQLITIKDFIVLPGNRAGFSLDVDCQAVFDYIFVSHGVPENVTAMIAQHQQVQTEQQKVHKQSTTPVQKERKPENLAAEPIRLELLDLSLEPTKVSAGSEFSFAVKYRITDTTMKSGVVQFKLSYYIVHNDQIKMEKTTQLSVKSGKGEILKKTLYASSKSGTYELRILLQYKEKIAGESVKFVIE